MTTIVEESQTHRDFQDKQYCQEHSKLAMAAGTEFVNRSHQRYKRAGCSAIHQIFPRNQSDISEYINGVKLMVYEAKQNYTNLWKYVWKNYE